MNDLNKRSAKRGQEPNVYPVRGNGRAANPAEELAEVRARCLAAIALLMDMAISTSVASGQLKRTCEEITKALDR